MSDEKTDIGALWEDALNEYRADSGGTDLRGVNSAQWNLGQILAEQEDQLRLFSKFRHDKGRVDRLRTLVSQNTVIIQNVAGYVVTAASEAFPPSAAVLTAFNYVMNASKAVSEDYEMIVQFFEVTHSFLERVSMLETRFQQLGKFQVFLIKVFKGLLTLSAIARKCRMGQGRLKKWARALYEGSDPRLKEAFQSLHTELERFDSATMIASLKTAIDNSRKLDTLDGKFQTVQTGVDMAVDLSKQGLVQGQKLYALEQETFSVAVDGKGFARDAAVRAQELLKFASRQEGNDVERAAAIKRMEHSMDTLRAPQQRGKPRGLDVMDTGAQKSMALRTLQGYLSNGYPGDFDDWEDQIAEIERDYVPETFQWIRDMDIYRNLAAAATRLVWLTGPPGMGKSTLTFVVGSFLREDFSGQPNTSVASFFFQEDDDVGRHFEHMLRSCALQIAVHDTHYREELLSDLQRVGDGKMLDELSSKDASRLWKRLFAARFSKTSGRRLVLLLDGADTTDSDSIKSTMEFIKDVSGDDANIHILFSSHPDFLHGCDQSRMEVFNLDKQMVEEDMRLIMTTRMKGLSRLSNLKKGVKNRICQKLLRKADGVRYIEHMLRRLNAIGREAPILEELKHPPDSTMKLYETLLEDCQRNRTDADLEVLRRLFAWLAYSREPLAMGSATKLLGYIATDNEINIDEEVAQKSSSITRRGYQEIVNIDYDSEKDEDDAVSDDEGPSTDQRAVVVGFHDRYLREHFRMKGVPHANSGSGLQSPPSLAHLMVFEAIVAILTSSGLTTNAIHSRADDLLVTYATKYWMKHLLEIRCEDLTDRQAGRLFDGLHTIISNRNRALTFFETRGPFNSAHSIFGSTDEEHDKVLKNLQVWAGRAISISSSGLSDGTAEWMRPFYRNPEIIYIRAAESHVANWFMNPLDPWEAVRSFTFARRALSRGKRLLEEQPDLLEYFSGDTAMKTTRKSILVVSKAFWQMQMTMTAQSYSAIGSVLRYFCFLEDSLKQFQIGLDRVDDDRDKVQIYSKMGEALVDLAWRANEEEIKESERQKANGETKPPEGKSDDHRAPALNGTDATGDSDGLGPLQGSGKREYWAQRAQDVLADAATLIDKLSPSDQKNKDVELKTAIMRTHLLRAKAELLQHKSDNFMQYLNKAVKVKLRNRSIQSPEIVKLLALRLEWDKVMGFLDAVGPQDQFYYLYLRRQGSLLFQQAAKETGKTQLLSQAWETSERLAGRFINPRNVVARVKYDHAVYCRTVLGPKEFGSAKVMLADVMATSSSSRLIAQASWELADILMEEFRGTRDPNKKMMAQREMKDLVARLKENMGSEYDWTQSQTTIPLAYMTRRLAAVEFQQGLEATFQGCVGLLRDSIIGNDSGSLRMLARVLAYVPGLERDAEIAATCQLYIVDIELWMREKNPLPEADKQEEVNGLSMPAVDLPEEEVNPDGDLDGSNSVICSTCGGRTSDWKHGAVYLCYYCTDLDLCQKCYNEKQSWETGETPPPWRILCGAGHKHIKAPVEGWKCLRSGVVHFETEKMPFDTWLLELKNTRWPQAWEQFWSEEMRDHFAKPKVVVA